MAKQVFQIKMVRYFVFFISILSSHCFYAQNRDDLAVEGFVALFNGTDLSNWKVPTRDNGHWKAVDSVIDYDAESEALKDKNLWSVKSYKDFVLYVDWRIKSTPFNNANVPIVKPDGTHKLNENNEVIRMTVPDSDSGIYLRGSSKSQVNIWCWPIGSGELYGYRTDNSMSQQTRKAVTPVTNADNNIGEWNRFKITLKGNVLNVELNDVPVIIDAVLPRLPEEGPIALQHHGDKKNGQWISPPSLVQFRNIYIKEL